jgi:hypothetical protein
MSLKATLATLYTTYLGRSCWGPDAVILSPSKAVVNEDAGAAGIGRLKAEKEAPLPMMEEWSTATGPRNKGGTREDTWVNAVLAKLTKSKT